MTEETQRLINSLREKTSTIRNKLVKLKGENDILRETLVQKEIDHDECRVALSELNHKYNALKIAKSLQNGDDNESLRKRIDAMVREIDTCIELVDE